MMTEELNSLVQELQGEKSKCSNQEDEMVEMLKLFESLEEVMRLTTAHGAFPNLPGLQEPSPEGPFPWSLRAVLCPPPHSGLPSCQAVGPL